MRFSKVSALAIAAVTAMVLCSFIPAADVSVAETSVLSDDQSEKRTYRYVSLGDSMSVGYGMTGYYPEEGPNQNGFLMDVEDTYPHLLTEYLRNELGDGYEVYHAQLGMSGTRSVEWRALIDDGFTGKDEYPGDDYTKGFFTGSTLKSMSDAARIVYPDISEKYADTDEGNFSLLKEVYRSELADADLITYNSHYDFGYDIAVKITDIISGADIDTDFTLYLEQRYIDLAEQAETIVLDYLIGYLAEQGLDLSDYKEMIEKVVRATVYALVSYCANYDAIMGYILSVNPDAKVLVIDVYDMFSPMDVKFNGMTISVSGLYDCLLDIANPYVKYCSPYALDSYDVDIDGSPMTIGNEFRYLGRGEISDDAKAGLVYAMGLVDKAADSKGVVYYDAIDIAGNGNLTKFMRCVFSSYEIDAEMFIGKDISEISAELIEKVTLAIKLTALPLTSVVQDPDDGSCTVSLIFSDSVTFTKGELSLLWVYLYLMSASGILAHTSPVGHSYIEGCIEAEIAKDDILSEGNRVYIADDLHEDVSDFTYELYTFAMKGARGAVTYLYKEWDAVVGYVNSDDYEGLYLKIQDVYDKWQEYYQGGGFDDDLALLKDGLIYLDDNWDTVFAGYADMGLVKQLRTIVKDVLNDWDSYEAGAKQSISLLDEKAGDLVGILEPESLRALMNDEGFSVKVRESLLYMGLNWDSFVHDLYDNAVKAETPEQFFDSIGRTIQDYERPCHEARYCEAVEPSCTVGCRDHYECKICSECFVQDGYGGYTEVSADDVIIPAVHRLTEHAAVEAGCETEGNNLYYTCDECGAVFKSDKVTVTTVDAETIAAKGHSCIEHAAVEAGCETEGHNLYYTCHDCDVVLKADKVTHTTVLEETIAAKGHSCIEHTAVAPGCETEGNNLYYTCHDCDVVLRSDMITHTTVQEETIAALGHAYHLHEATEATCIKEGNNEYYTCDHECGAVFKSDKVTRTTILAETIAKTEHIHQAVPGVTPTKTEPGWTESEICSYCKKTLIEAKEIPATGTDEAKIVSDSSNVSFMVKDSEEMKALKVSLSDKLTGVKSGLSVPEGTIASLKGKVLQFSVDKSEKASDTYEIGMTADGSAFNGEVYISLPYDSSKGTPSVKWVDQDTPMEVVSIDSEAGLVTFKTTHNSTYQVTYSNESGSSSDVWTYAIIAVIIIIALLIVGFVVWKKKQTA